MKSTLKAVALFSILASGACATMGGSTTTTPATAIGSSGTSSSPVEVNDSRRGVLPVGQQMDVRLQDTLSSATATSEQRFAATTLVNLEQDGTVLVPAGSAVRGVVGTANPAGRVDGGGSLTLSFDQITVNGRAVPLRAMATQAFESRGIRDEVGTVAPRAPSAPLSAASSADSRERSSAPS